MKKPVFSILGLAAFIILVAAGIYFRFSFYVMSASVKELMVEAERFLDGFSEAAFFYSPAPAGTIEAYAALFSVTGINEDVVMIAVICLEAACSILLFFISKIMLSDFYAYLCLAATTLLAFFGVSVNIYEELGALGLLFFETMTLFTRKYEEAMGEEEGVLFLRYLFTGLTAGLAVFLMSSNIILVLLTLVLSVYFLMDDNRGVKLWLELLIMVVSAAAVFFVLILTRVMNTALLPAALLRGYVMHVTDSVGAQYLLCCVLITVLFVIEMIMDLLSGRKRSGSEKEPVPAAEHDIDQNRPGESGLKQRPVTTGALPDDFVLHRGSKDGGELVPEASPQNTPLSAANSARVVAGAAATASASGVNASASDPSAGARIILPSERITMEEAKEVVNSFIHVHEEDIKRNKQRRKEEYIAYVENLDINELEFDFDIPEDDDFEVEVKFDNAS